MARSRRLRLLERWKLSKNPQKVNLKKQNMVILILTWKLVRMRLQNSQKVKLKGNKLKVGKTKIINQKKAYLKHKNQQKRVRKQKRRQKINQRKLITKLVNKSYMKQLTIPRIMLKYKIILFQNHPFMIKNSKRRKLHLKSRR